MDCTTERSICERFGVQSYPTLKVVSGGRFFDYAGSREVSALAKFTVSGHKVNPLLLCSYAVCVVFLADCTLSFLCFLDVFLGESALVPRVWYV